MKFPPYAEMKAAPVAWLDCFPSHWSVVPFWSIFRRKKQTGYPDETLLSVYRDYGVIPKASRDDNANRASEDLSTYQLVEPGDLAINKMKAWQGSVAVSDHRGIVSPAYFIFKPNHNINSRYLHYLFRSKNYIAGYLSISKGVRVNQWDLDPDKHRVMPVLIPKPEEQAMIVSFLDAETKRIDELIEIKHRFISLLLEKKSSIIANAITRGIAPNATLHDSEVEWVGKIPSHWAVIRVADLFREVDRPADTTLPVLSVSINGGVTDKELEDDERDRIVNLSDDRTKYQRVCPGDLVYNMMRAWQGAFGTVSVDGLVSPAYVVAQPKSDFLTKFIELSLQTSMGSEEVRRYSKGIADFRMRLYWEHFRNLKICLPPLAEQAEIIRHIEMESARIDYLVSKTDHSIDLLKEHRSALITSAVTGKINVCNQSSRHMEDAA